MHLDFLFIFFFFFFNDTATTEIYTFPTRRSSDRLPCRTVTIRSRPMPVSTLDCRRGSRLRSEEHTSELQSRQYLVCRLLLEKKKNTKHRIDFDAQQITFVMSH